MLDLILAGVFLLPVGREMYLRLGRVEFHAYGAAQLRKIMEAIRQALSKADGDGVLVTPTPLAFDRNPIGIMRSGDNLIFEQNGRRFTATPSILKLIDRKLKTAASALDTAKPNRSA